MTPPNDSDRMPITLSQMGSFMFAGKVLTDSGGDTYHGDHGYAQYFVPEPARDFPIIMWHGLGQSGKTWESTPDGRDGFWQIFTRREWPVYMIDQPRRGRAGRAVVDETEAATAVIPTTTSESQAWNTFRLGVWEPPAAHTFYPGLQFPLDSRALDQFLRQQTPGTGAEPFPDVAQRRFLGESVADLFREVGPAVLLTHSHSGQYGWVTAMTVPELVKGIVAIEPGEFAFPENELPPDVVTDSELMASFMAPQAVPMEDFLELTRIPILILMGDNITHTPSADFGIELWRVVRERAKQFVEAISRHGGDATYVELPQMGINGNSHFMMADLNNREIADLIEGFLSRKGLDSRDHPHVGPRRS